MKKRIIGFVLGLAGGLLLSLAAISTALVIAGVLALTFIGIPLAILAVVVGGLVALVMPLAGAIAGALYPDQLLANWKEVMHRPFDVRGNLQRIHKP